MDQRGKRRNTPLTQGHSKNIHDNSSQGRGENNQSISPITQQKLQGTITFNTTDKATGKTHVHAHTQGITGSPSCWGSGLRVKRCLLYSPPCASKNHPQGQNGPCHCPYQPVCGHAHCAEEIGVIQQRKCHSRPHYKKNVHVLSTTSVCKSLVSGKSQNIKMGTYKK